MATQSAGRVLIIPKGDYSETTMYSALDLVLYNGSSWICKKLCTGQEPTTDNTDYWQEFANITEITEAVAQTREYSESAETSAESASSSASSASTSATNAMSSALSASSNASNAKTSETNAKTSEENAKTSETNAKTSETNAETYGTLSESYAVGGTGTREGEDTDNAKYYYERAKEVVAVDIATVDTAGIVKPDGTTITIEEDGTIHGASTVEVDGTTIVQDSETKQISVSDDFANSKLDTNGDSKSCTSTFTSDDVEDGSATEWTSVTALASGATHSNIFTKLSKMFKNIRYLYKLLGTTDISAIGDGTATGAISSLNSDLANICNDNLVDNGWFTINQRGDSSYTGTKFGVDRWNAVGTGMTVTVKDEGVGITATSDTSDNAFVYNLPLDEYKYAFADSTFTLSVKNEDDTIQSMTFTCPSLSDIESYTGWKQIKIMTLTNGITVNFLFSKPSTNMIQICIRPPKDGAEYIIKAVKLERGILSTLVNDSIPNYQQELAKCQRYYRRYYNIYINSPIFIGVGSSETTVRVMLPFSMRTITPTVVVNNMCIRDNVGGGVASATAITSASCIGDSSSLNPILVCTVASATIGEIYPIVSQASGGYIEFSAEI